MVVFHRVGLIEQGGLGTNRVIESCKQHGAPPPIFEERQGFVIVTFKAQIVAGGAAGTKSELESQPESLDRRVLIALRA